MQETPCFRRGFFRPYYTDFIAGGWWLVLPPVAMVLVDEEGPYYTDFSTRGRWFLLPPIMMVFSG